MRRKRQKKDGYTEEEIENELEECYAEIEVDEN